MSLRRLDILPLNTIELMTLINFKHLDEEKMLASERVLKQKSGYTHDMGEELIQIFREIEITPEPKFLTIYGENYLNVLAYNTWLQKELFPDEKNKDFLVAFELLAPFLYKLYGEQRGYEKSLLTLRMALKENWPKKKLDDQLKVIKEEICQLLTVEEMEVPVGIRKFLVKLNLVTPRLIVRRYPFFSQVEQALQIFSGEFARFIAVEQIAEFANTHQKIIATLIQRFQELGVDARNENTPNFDFLQFYTSYVGKLEVKFDEDE
jgi:hypothetical protein